MHKLTFNKIYSREVLYEAAFTLYNKAVFFPHKAKVRSYDNESLYDFGVQFQRVIREAHNELKRQSFLFAPVLQKEALIGDKKRKLYIEPWKDKLVDTMLYRILDRALDSFLYKDSFAFRQRGSKGVFKCVRTINSMINKMEGPIYVIRRDVSNFFPSINRDILKKKIAQIVDEEDYLYLLLCGRIDFEAVANGVTVPTERGVAFGTPLACLFGNIYLTELDKALRRVKAKVFRYADDYLVLTTSRDVAIRVRELFEEHFKVLDVSSKTSHEQDYVYQGIPDSRFKAFNKIEYLGVRFNGQIRLGTNKVKKIKRIFKSTIDRCLKNKYKRASIEVRLDKVVNAVRNVWEHPRALKSRLLLYYSLGVITDETQLKELDRWCHEYLMHAVCGYKGFSRQNLKYASLAQLRALGVYSFLHESRMMRRQKRSPIWSLLMKK